MIIQGRLVDILGESINPVKIVVEEGIIQSVNPLDPNAPGDRNTPANSNEPGRPNTKNAPNPHDLNASEHPKDASGPYILPGFIDAHVHIESSLLIPSEFARLAVIHGTIATVSDPHEIANVCGLPGIEFMIRNGHTVPFYFFFGAPSCVPATTFETAGATLDAAAVTQLLENPEILYLSELMNFPGVLNKDPEVMAKIAAAHRLGKPVDGHAPGLRGDQARAYIAAGISTDHECFTAEEALEKLQAGMKILIREGSAARNFDALIDLLNDWPEQMMFCSDDKHPDSLLAGHINSLCARAAARKINIFKILRAACLNPIEHYKLPTGRLRPGDPADFIIVEDLHHFKVLETYVKGQLVAKHGQSHISSTHLVPSTAPASSGNFLTASPVNNFKATPKNLTDFAYPLDKWGEQENVEQCYCIEALEGQLITNKLTLPISDVLPRDGRLHSNPEKDILKIVVVNRYQQAPVAKSFIRNVGLKRGAIASSVAHDSHNIVAVGVDDESLCRAVNLIIENKGGLSCVDANPAAAPNAASSGSNSAASSGSNSAASGSDSALSSTDSVASSSNSALSVRPHPAPSEITGEPIPLITPAAGSELILPLPVAGLMSLDDGFRVADQYIAIDNLAKELGSTLAAPFMTLSFMALLVIPHLKLSDLGLFDGDKFSLV